MNRTYLFLVSLLVTAFMGSFDCNAQLSDAQTKELLLKIDDSIANIKTVVYKIDYTNKYLARRDTIHTTAVCSLYIAPRDKMKAYNIVDGMFTEINVTQYLHRGYNGKKTSWANCLVDSLGTTIKPEIYTDKRLNRSIVQNYSHLLLTKYINIKKPFGRYVPAIGLIKVTEEALHGVPVYVIGIAYKPTKDVRDSVDKHYVRKSDLLPVAFSSFLRWENMEQYNYYEVDYLAINPNITPEDFKIEMDEIINAKERYAAYLKKTEK